MWSRSYQSVPGLGQVASSEYKAEKLETNELSEEVKAAWQKREGKAYVLVNEKYTSTLYNAAMPMIPIHTVNELPGYVYTNKIVGANQAVNQLQIPGLAGRDTMEFNFYEENGVEYVTAGGNVYALKTSSNRSMRENNRRQRFRRMVMPHGIRFQHQLQVKK